MHELIKQVENILGRSIIYEESDDSSYIEIKDAQLTGLSVTSSDIKYISFINCDLTGSKFNSCKFTGVIFEDCDLTNCDFTDAIFGDFNSFNKSHGSNISFIRASILNQLYMELVEFDTCFFNGLTCEGGWLEANYSSITNSKFMDSVNLHGIFKYTNFEGSDFNHLDLGEFISGAYQINMSRTILEGSWLSSTSPKSIRSLNMALMVGCNLRYANMKSVDLSYTNMSNAIITNCSFEDCIFDHVLMSDSTIKDARFQYGCVSYTDLRNSELINVKFHNVNLDLTNMCDIKVNDVALINCNMMNTMMTENTGRELTIMSDSSADISIICIDTNVALLTTPVYDNPVEEFVMRCLAPRIITLPLHDNPVLEYIKSCYITKGAN